MSLRSSYFLYLGLLHVAILSIASLNYTLLGRWFFGVELLVALSWGLGIWLVRRILKPQEFLQSFSDLLSEREFSARFSPVGQPEMDRLITLYNQMLTSLYRERLRLGEQRGFLEQFVQESSIGVVIMDFDHHITMVNPAAAKLLEVSERELSGSKLESLNSALAQELARLEVGASQLMTWRSIRRLRLEKQSFIDRGFSRQFVVIEELTRVIDASERAAYEKLIRLMSHEVNNTVAATNSLLESCRTYAPQIQTLDREDYSNALKVVIERNQNLNRFVSDFAQVVKLPEPSKRPCQLSAILESLEVMFRVPCRDRSIHWIRSGDPQVQPVSLDREQIEQVLINIIKNAIEAIDHEGTLELKLSQVNDHVELRVLDDGQGLNHDTQSHLFSPFFSTKTQGQGLGLTLAKEILLKHRFDFGLETVTDGRTCFMMRIPLGGR